MIDAAGSRRTDDGFGYAVTLLIGHERDRDVGGRAHGAGAGPTSSRVCRRSGRVTSCAGTCLTAAYGLVLVAVQHAPVGYVATLRESSVVIGALLGWLLLQEPLGGRRLVSSIIVTVGLVALVVFR